MPFAGYGGSGEGEDLVNHEKFIDEVERRAGRTAREEAGPVARSCPETLREQRLPSEKR